MGRNGLKTIQAKVPLANMFQYISDLRSMTKGRAQYSMVFDSYAFVPPDVEKTIVEKYGKKEGAPALVAEDQNNVVGTSSLALLFGCVVVSGIMFMVFKRSRQTK